jgi:hypothetical protein
MAPSDAVHHAYIVVFSTLLPRAKLQSGVSLAVLWRGVSELSFVSDTEHCLMGNNLWLPSWDLLKQFVKGRNVKHKKKFKLELNKMTGRFRTELPYSKMEGETCVRGTSKHKQKGNTLCETRKGTAVSRHTCQPSHNCSHPQSQRSKQVSPMSHSCQINCYCRAGDSGDKQKTRLMVNSYEMKHASRVYWYRHTEWLPRECNSQITL